MSRIIVVTGGVISGIGKGIATGSIGRILKEHGFSVTAIKIDPYINYDAGTLRPTEHGEVWVTDDGGEIDQDLGTYERFLNQDIPRRNNVTTGQVYKAIIDKERSGKFLGQTVQFIPHVPDEIKRRIKEAGKDYDFTLVEIGGTIGDYENLPFLFAIKSLEIELGRENVANVLVSYLPIPSNVGEMKTKPTQQAISMLNETGISPDFVLCRAPKPLDDVRKKKIEIYANIASENIISAPDIETIYEAPLKYEAENLGEKILDRFELKSKKKPDWSEWKKLVEKIKNPKKKAKIAIIGKYLNIGDYSLVDSYISINEALIQAGAECDSSINIEWIDAKTLENNHGNVEKLKEYDGLLVPGGFGTSGFEGKINAIRYARENNIPFLGLCLGLQLAVVEFARSIGMKANTTEAGECKCPVIDILPEQRKILEKNQYGATMRLGAYAAILEKSRVLDLYEKTGRLDDDKKRIEELKKSNSFRLGILDSAKNIVLERHRHRFEVNPEFVEELVKNGLVFSGYHVLENKTKLMEFIELPKHKFFIATQAHPEFKSRLGDASPLFLGFVEACSKS